MHHVYDTIRKRRTIRRFKPKPIPEKTLLQLVDAARLAPSGSNLQPCEFIVVNQPQKLAQMFECIKWNDAAAPSGIPDGQERPVAYMVVLVDLTKRKKGGAADAAAAAENAVLAACELGIGTCWIREVHRKKLKKTLRVPHHLYVEVVLALGYPDESPVAEEADGSMQPWVDADGVTHVPKRKLSGICHMNEYRHGHPELRKSF